jgi:hypothetical protein
MANGRQVINYSTRDYAAVMAQFDADPELREQPERFKRGHAGIFDALSNLANAMANSAFINTAFSRPHLQDLLALIDYAIPWKLVATVTQEFTIDPAATASSDYTVLAADLVAGTIGTSSSPAQRYEARSDLTFTIGTTVSSVTLYNQTTQPQQIIGATDGSDYQEIDLPDLDVVKDTLVITIGSDVYSVVSTFADSGSTDPHFKLYYRSDGSSYIKLPGLAPDGTAFGKKPGIGQDIIADYAIGGGIEGNKSAGTITEYLGTDTNVLSTVNNLAASDGAPEQSLSLAKEQSRLELRSVGFFTNESTALGLVRANVEGIINLSIVRTGTLEVDVFLQPSGGGNPTTEQKLQAQDILQRKSFLEEVAVNPRDPIYITTSIIGTARVAEGYSFGEILKYIEFASAYRVSEIGFFIHESFLNDDLSDTIALINGTLVSGGLVSASFTTQDDGPQIQRILSNVPFQRFGEDLHPEDIVSAVQGFVIGVDFVKIQNPTSPISVNGGSITQPTVITWSSV